MAERRLTPSRKTERMSQDRAELDVLLDQALVGYLGISLPEGPLVLPVSYARDGDRILFHGSTGSHRMRAIAEGAEVCFTVAEVDGLKVARSGDGTGMQYRSAVLFGSCSVLPDDQKAPALERYLDRYLPGRVAEVRPASRRELAATMLLALPIDQWSVKVAVGFPCDPDEDLAGDAWAGVLPLRLAYGDPQPSPDLRDGIAVPASVLALYR